MQNINLKSKISGLKFEKGIFLLILILSVVSLHFVSSVECYTLSISHLPQFHKAETFLIISDLSGIGPSVNVRFYDEFGKEISTINKLLPPKGKINIEISDHIKSPGSIILESVSEMIVAEYWLINKDGTASMIPLRPTIRDERYFVNCLRMPICEETIIAINDPKGSGPMVQIELYNTNGELVKIARKMLRPYGILTFKLSDYEPNNTIGKVSIRSFGGSICPYVIHTYKKKVLWAFPMSVLSRNFIMDNVSIGNEIISNIAIIDTSSRENRIWISILDNKGVKIAEGIKILSPNSAIMIDLSEFTDNLNDGIINIISDFEIMADYWETKAKYYDIRIDNATRDLRPSFKEAINKESILLSSYYHYSKNIDFLMTFINTGHESTVIDVDFYSDNGGKIVNKRLNLEPFKVFRESIGRYFGNAKLGTVIVKNLNSNLLVTTSIVNVKGDRVLGKISSISY